MLFLLFMVTFVGSRTQGMYISASRKCSVQSITVILQRRVGHTLIFFNVSFASWHWLFISLHLSPQPALIGPFSIVNDISLLFSITSSSQPCRHQGFPAGKHNVRQHQKWFRPKCAKASQLPGEGRQNKQRRQNKMLI